MNLPNFHRKHSGEFMACKATLKVVRDQIIRCIKFADRLKPGEWALFQIKHTTYSAPKLVHYQGDHLGLAIYYFKPSKSTTHLHRERINSLLEIRKFRSKKDKPGILHKPKPDDVTKVWLDEYFPHLKARKLYLSKITEIYERANKT